MGGGVLEQKASYLGPDEISSVVHLVKFNDRECGVSCLYRFS